MIKQSTNRNTSSVEAYYSIKIMLIKVHNILFSEKEPGGKADPRKRGGLNQDYLRLTSKAMQYPCS